jgi:hypothetical protein
MPRLRLISWRENFINNIRRLWWFAKLLRKGDETTAPCISPSSYITEIACIVCGLLTSLEEKVSKPQCCS